MRAHPEGGWYVETWRAAASAGGSAHRGSAILYLLAAGERSHWHRLDADEVWQWSAGDALELRLVARRRRRSPTHRLGPAVATGRRGRPGRRARGCLADGALARRVDAGRLHRDARPSSSTAASSPPRAGSRRSETGCVRQWRHSHHHGRNLAPEQRRRTIPYDRPLRSPRGSRLGQRSRGAEPRSAALAHPPRRPVGGQQVEERHGVERLRARARRPPTRRPWRAARAPRPG